jgi:hypothetical protein
MLSPGISSPWADGASPGHSTSAGDEHRPEHGRHASRVDAAAFGVPEVQKLLRWRPMILLALALICLITGISGFVILPVRATVVNPSPFEVKIVSKYAISHVLMSIWPSRRAVRMQIGAMAEQAPGTTQNEGYIDIYFVGGRAPVACPSGVSCSYSPISGQGTGQQEIAVPITVSPNGDADSHTVAIEDRRFGPATNSESTIVELPTVTTASDLPGAAPTIDFAYKVPSADTYDWSIPPTRYIGSEWADWSEQLSSSVSEVPPAAVTGTNDSVQAHDSNDTLIGDILLGIAGAAALALVQEGLHMLVDRGKKSRVSKTRRESLSATR